MLHVGRVQPTCGSRKTHIKRFNRAVPDNVSPQTGRRAADDDVIINGYTLCPQDLALLGALEGVVLEADGGRLREVDRVGAQTAGVALVPLPVGRDDAAALWPSSGGFWTITGRRWAKVVDGFRARRLHPFTVAGWAGGASNRQAGLVSLSKGLGSEGYR